VQTVLTAAAALTPLERIENAAVVIRDGLIERIGPLSAIEISAKAKRHDFPSAQLVPGLLDIHIHGAVGNDVMTADSSGLAAMEDFLTQHGVTGYCPTTVTAPLDSTLTALERLAKRIEKADDAKPRARPLGIHLEGPFISREKRGVHPQQDIVAPDVKLFERLWNAARGQVKVLTIAPELPGAPEVIAAAASKGVCVAIGHSNGDLASARMAMEAGARHATHTFNAMRALEHREPGIAGAVLTETALTADIIADGIHVHPAVVKLFLAAKRDEKALLISDGTSATGMPDGRYKLGTFEVEVAGDRCTVDGRLAGSVLTLDRAVRNVMRFAGWPLQRALRLATANPAAVINAKNCGALTAGARADLVVISQQGEVVNAVVGGRVLHQ
jgi:N-acetylglucosamine-6-phosphate deacetylase